MRLEAEIVAVSSDNMEDIKELSHELNLPYPLLSDPEKGITAKYISLKEEKDALTPALFIVDRYGALIFQQISEKAADLPDPEEVLEWIRYVENHSRMFASLVKNKRWRFRGEVFI